jgi:hypothetical protein
VEAGTASEQRTSILNQSCRRPKHVWMRGEKKGRESKRVKSTEKKIARDYLRREEGRRERERERGRKKREERKSKKMK